MIEPLHMPPGIGTALSVVILHLASRRGKMQGIAIAVVGVATAYAASVMFSSWLAMSLIIDLDAFKVYGIANAVPIAAATVAFSVASLYGAGRKATAAIALVGGTLTIPFYLLIVLAVACQVIKDCL